MIPKRLVWVGLLCLLHTPYLFAQQKVYSLEEIWKKTLDQHPSLAARKELVAREELNKLLVRQQSHPEINLQAQQSFGSYQNKPGAFFSLPGLYNNSGSAKATDANNSGANIYGSAVLQWNFMQFGRVQKRLDVADAAIVLSQSAVSREAFELQTTATRYYFDALYRLAQLHVLRSDVNRLASLLDLLKSQAGAGLRPGADTLLIKSAFLQAKNKLTDQRTRLQASLLQLGALIGDQGNSLSIDTAVYYRFHTGRVAAEASLSTHPYLQYLDAVINHSKAQLETIRKEPYPSMGVFAGAGIKGSGIESSGTVNKSLVAPWNNNSGSYLVGLGVTWKLSAFYQNKTKKKMAEREVASAKASHETAKLQLQTLYTSALAAYGERVNNVKEALLALEASQEAYGLYSVRYESGLIDLVELLQLQKDLQAAESNYVMAVHSYWSELMDQSEALGAPSIVLTAIKP